MSICDVPHLGKSPSLPRKSEILAGISRLTQTAGFDRDDGALSRTPEKFNSNANANDTGQAI